MIDPRSADAQLTLARIQLSLKNIEEARKAFNDTLKLDPHSMAASLELSELHRNRNEMDTAIQFAEQALVGNSDSVVARMTLVRALLIRDEDHERAEKELQTLISRHPESARAQGILGQLLLNRNELAGAERIFTQELKLDPQSVEAMTGLVAIDLSRKRTAEARARIDAFLAKHPQSASALVIAAKVYREAGDPAKVEQLLMRALAADASNPAIYALLAEHYISQKRLGEAHKQFAAIVKLQPRSVAANTMMGLICFAEGNLDDAQRWWEKTLQIDVYAAAAANNLAWLYAEGRGNLEVALQLAQTAKSKYPTLPEVNDTLGWVYYRKDLIAQGDVVFAAEPRPRSEQPDLPLPSRNGVRAQGRRCESTPITRNRPSLGSENARGVAGEEDPRHSGLLTRPQCAWNPRAPVKNPARARYGAIGCADGGTPSISSISMPLDV